LRGSSLPGSPLPGSPLPGSPLPGSSLPGSPLPGSPLPGSPLPGSPLRGSPLRGSQSAGAGSAGGRPVHGWLAADGLNDGRATVLSIRAAAGGQPSSRRCRPLAAAGPVGRGAAFERVGERTPARRGQIDRRTRSKSRSRISRTPAIACQGSKGLGYDETSLTSSSVTECNARLPAGLFPITTCIHRRIRAGDG
jgi:hypothetical protein